MNVWNINWVLVEHNLMHDIDISKRVGEFGDRPEFVYEQIINEIFDLSQDWCPVKTGQLKSSGRIYKNSIGTYSIIYQTPYAPYVHEIDENRHLAPTRSHWLEDAAYSILNRYEIFGIGFSFSMNITVVSLIFVLQIIKKHDFEFNRHYGEYVAGSFHDNRFHDIEPIKHPNIEISEV